MRSDRADPATAGLLLLGPLGLLGGAYGFQYLGGLNPCEMCWWQRYALMVALALAALGWVAGRSRPLLVLAALAVLANTGIAVFHAGVEQHWWPGITACAATAASGSSADIMGQIMAQPLIRCDAIAWSLFGISMAGWNAIISAGIGGLALWRLVK
jgi:disulfide bond formation protein DsbB